MTVERKLAGRAPAWPLPPGAVDSQCHVYLPGFPAQPGGPGLPPGALPDPEMYRRLMGWLGIGRTVITQGNAHQRDNDSLLACLAAFGPAARGVAVIRDDTPAAELQRLADGGVVGARIMDLPGGAAGLDQLEAVDRLAASMGWMLAVQFNGSQISRHAERLAGLRSRWVLDHHGKFFDGATEADIDHVLRLIDGGRMWFKFAGCYESSRTGGPDYADIAVHARRIAAHAPERIVWGSNFPHNAASRTEDYPDDAELLDLAMSWLPDDSARRRAVLANPEELFGLPAVG